MNAQAEIISIIVFAFLIIYGIFGTYTLSLNPSSKMNRMFFLISIFLCVWAFAIAMGNVAPNYETAILWRRAGSLGWGVLYSLLLHYLLMLTGRANLLKSKMTYIFLYLPVLVNILFFGLYSPVAITQYNLIQIKTGWVNVPTGSIGDIFFNSYYLLFSLLSLITIWTWENVANDKRRKRIVHIISITFTMGILGGFIIDTMFHQLPQLSVLFACFPLAGINYSIRKQNLMGAHNEKGYEDKDLFVYERRTQFYNYLSYAVIAGSVLNIMFYSHEMIKIQSILTMSLVILVFGITIRLIPLLQVSSAKQDTILLILLPVFIVLILLYFTRHYGNNAVWPIPIIFLTASVMFRQKSFFYSTLAITLLYHFWSLTTEPVSEITVGAFEYTSHITMYFVIAALASYVNKTYRKRLADHEKQIEIQREISRISSEFAGANPMNINEKINDVFKLCGTFFGIEHSFMFRFSNDMSEAYYSNEWFGEGNSPAKGKTETLSINDYPWWMEKLQNNNRVFIRDVDNLPDEAVSVKQFMQNQHIKSLISVAMHDKDRLIGFLGFDVSRSEKTWELEHQAVLQILANIISDALVKIEAEKRINQMAYYDNLTNLPNRIYFNMELDQMLKLAKRNEKLVGVLFLDLDLFKSINDSLGHEAGDKLLITIGDRLTNLLRESDMACRFGGDEFLIMLPQMKNLEDIRKATEKIMKAFEEPVTINGQDFYVTASSGVAVYPLDGEDSETLIKNSDLAMYESKNKGRNRYTFCTPIMKEEIREKVQLSNDLYRALEREELVLFYQPQLSIETGEIIGLEALIRWIHPERGIISPGVFIPMAEQTGLIQSIGEWVIKTASKQNKTWQQKGYDPIAVAVNISVEQFRGSQLVEVVAEALKESKLEPKYLELEITESIAIQGPDYIIGVLESLKSLGVSIAIDDFGTEYSSLSRLKELPVDKLKMAMEFVQGIDKDSKDKSIATVIINLAKSLGLKIIAEGVEKKGQLDFLRDRACDEAQGFFFYRPMPVEEVEKLLNLKR
ncbi:putative bifunctional diguanylate cyclase/phosphodiesterase [Gudongella sp. DL1XJH-153]|uniref:putative bifunctional diguanylate cyclase/phosphodiesterase n=1 Tax=Gudongella sp. DL1XJH-153 TaxID=3409804 RepID=UPI003BB55130